MSDHGAMLKSILNVVDNAESSGEEDTHEQAAQQDPNISIGSFLRAPLRRVMLQSDSSSQDEYVPLQGSFKQQREQSSVKQQQEPPQSEAAVLNFKGTQNFESCLFVSEIRPY